MNFLRKLATRFLNPSGYDLTNWENFTSELIKQRKEFDRSAGIITIGSGSSLGYQVFHPEGELKGEYIELGLVKGNQQTRVNGEIKVFFSFKQKDMGTAWKIISELIFKHGIAEAKFVRPDKEFCSVIFDGAQTNAVMNKPIVIYTTSYSDDGKTQAQREETFKKFLSDAERQLRKSNIEPAGHPRAARQIPGSEFIFYRNAFAPQNEGYISSYIADKYHAVPHNPFNRPDFLENMSFRPHLHEVKEAPKTEALTSRVTIKTGLHDQHFILVFPKFADGKAIQAYCNKIGFKGEVRTVKEDNETHVWPTNSDDKKLLGAKCRMYMEASLDEVTMHREKHKKNPDHKTAIEPKDSGRRER